MKPKTLETWDDFESAISELEKERDGMKMATATHVSKLLYRGQRDSKWKLETTLERNLARDITLSDYYRIAMAAKPRIETFTATQWDIPKRDEYEAWLEEREMLTFGDIKAYEYFAYLRHHGFPSPLLDWTASPYIAAFFAFNRAEKQSEHVSIYAYQEYIGRGKGATFEVPLINCLGNNIRTDKRHFLQQSQYTICTVLKADSQYYAKHEEIILRNDSHQDRLWKFSLPVSERKNALKKLDRMNITAYSLFGTEDSLLETIATNDLFLKGT